MSRFGAVAFVTNALAFVRGLVWGFWGAIKSPLAILILIMGGMGVVGGMIISDYDKKMMYEATKDLTDEELDAASEACHELSGRAEIMCYNSFDADAGSKD